MTTATARLYETDFYGWIQQQAAMLRARNLDDLDFDNLIEEVESMGRRERRELEDRLEVLLAHLLKWQYQPSFRSKSGQCAIAAQRLKINNRLQESPSLKSLMPESCEEAYGYAVFAAIRETGLAQSTFPAQCPWTFEQAMDADFWPEG